MRLALRPLLLALLAVLLAEAAAAQPSARLRVGYDHYRLSDLRSSQARLQGEFRQQGVPVEPMSAFPAYPSLRLEVAAPLWGVHRGGLSVGLGSTGARSHYADYSGEVRADWVAARRSVGAFVEQDALRQRDVTGVLALHVGADFARVTYDAVVRVGEEEETARQEVTGRGFYLQPELSVERALPRGGFVRAGAGYGVTLRGGFALLPQTVYRPEWTGWRLGVTFGWRAPVRPLPENSANPAP
jgi:hypothetical protein